MLKKYKLSFEICGVLLFLIVMIPNFIWFAIPAPNDILRAKSITETVDTVASVCQILMIAAICIFRNKESKKLCITPLIIMAAVCYYIYDIMSAKEKQATRSGICFSCGINEQMSDEVGQEARSADLRVVR